MHHPILLVCISILLHIFVSLKLEFCTYSRSFFFVFLCCVRCGNRITWRIKLFLTLRFVLSGSATASLSVMIHLCIKKCLTWTEPRKFRSLLSGQWVAFCWQRGFRFIYTRPSQRSDDSKTETHRIPPSSQTLSFFWLYTKILCITVSHTVLSHFHSEKFLLWSQCCFGSYIQTFNSRAKFTAQNISFELCLFLIFA